MKNIPFIFISILLILSVSSCVPYKNIVYVQGDFPDNVIDSTAYKIQKNDILYVKLKSGNETVERLFKMQQNIATSNRNSESSLYFEGYTVDNKGYIELPVIDKIYVEGKTFKEVKEIIKHKLLETQFRSLNDIYIKVKLAGVPFTVLGEVKNPRTGVLYKEKPTLFDILGGSSDITLVGNRKKVTVIRREQNKLVKKTLDLTDSGVVSSPYFYMRPNDIIYVPPLPQKTWGTGTTLQQSISTTITALSLITTIILFSKYVK